MIENSLIKYKSGQEMMAWLEAQPGYWRGRATTRQCGSDVDIWSDEALVNHRKAAEYEFQAEKCEIGHKNIMEK